MPSHRNDAMNQVVEHLQQMADWFNSSARDNDLDISLDAGRCLLQLRNPGMFFAADILSAYANYRVTEEQVRVAVQAIARTVSQPRRSGLINNQHNGGAAGTGMMMMFACPVGFLISGIRRTPLYLTANDHRRLGEVRGQIRGFLKLYGELEIKASHPVVGQAVGEDGGFDLVTYLNGLAEAERYPSGQDLFTEIASGATARRMPGSLTLSIEGPQQRASEGGHELMTILEDALLVSGRSSPAAQPSSGPVHRAFAGMDAAILDDGMPGIVIGITRGTATTSTSSPVWTL